MSKRKDMATLPDAVDVEDLWLRGADREVRRIGPWVVEEALGTGGMGSVYRCHNRHAPRLLAAVKLLDPLIMHNDSARASFINEAEVVSGLDHRHIVKISNLELDANPPYIEMEFVRGRSMEELFADGGLPLNLGILAAEQLLKAVKYMHRKGVAHRDIKPANIIISRGAVLKLVDFGIALDGPRENERPEFVTPQYAPPELLDQKDFDPKAWDLYAIGVTLFEVLTGKSAFPVDKGLPGARRRSSIILQKRERTCLDLGEAFPEDMRQLIKDLTHREKDRRPAKAEEVLRRVRQLAHRPDRGSNWEEYGDPDTDRDPDSWEEPSAPGFMRELREYRNSNPPPTDAVPKPPARPLPPWLVPLAAGVAIGALAAGGFAVALM